MTQSDATILLLKILISSLVSRKVQTEKVQLEDTEGSNASPGHLAAAHPAGIPSKTAARRPF